MLCVMYVYVCVCACARVGYVCACGHQNQMSSSMTFHILRQGLSLNPEITVLTILSGHQYLGTLLSLPDAIARVAST